MMSSTKSHSPTRRGGGGGATKDERDIQQKALDRWEEQKRVWDRMQANLAKKVHKHPDETLQGSIHHFRQRQEELGMIDTSVPAEIKNGVSAWEMNLRAGVGGVRYVQIGSSYPYPLYCPIRDAESVKPDNHILMRVLPEHVPPRHKPVSETAYFQSRQEEFKKHIRRKFSHFTDQHEAFSVVGAPPPLAQRPVREDASIEPVVFVPYTGPPASSFAAANGADLQGASASLTEFGKIPTPADEARSRPLSAIQGTARAPGTPQSAASPAGLAGLGGQQEGPMLMFSASHLGFLTSPGEPAQATLAVDNIGSTAVFYSWVPVAGDSVVAAAGGTSAATRSGASAGSFALSDILNGVLLPEDSKLFTFSFRAPVGGVFSTQYELLTVPAGKERIIVNLRGVVLSDGGDAVRAAQLERSLVGSAPAVDAHNLFTEVLTAATGNAFDESEVRSAVQRRLGEDRQKVIDANAEQVARRARWLRCNAALKLPFNKAVYTKISDLHRRFKQFMAHVQAEVAAAVPSSPNAPSEAASAVTQHAAAGGKRTTPIPTSSTPTVDGPRPPSAAGKAAATAAAAAAAAKLPALVDVDLPAPSPAASERVDYSRLEVPEWGGCVKSLLEEISAVRDAQIRTMFLNALGALLGAAAQCKGPTTLPDDGEAEAAEALDSGEDEQTVPLETLLLRAAASSAFGDAADQIHWYSQTARDLAEGKGVLKGLATKDKNDKGAKGAAAAAKDKKTAPPAKSAAGGATATTAAVAAAGSGGEAPDAKPADYDAFFFAGCRRIVGDAVEGIFTTYDNNTHVVACMCDRPLETLVARRIGTVVAAHAAPEAELEPVLDANPKGKKK